MKCQNVKIVIRKWERAKQVVNIVMDTVLNVMIRNSGREYEKTA